MPFKSEKQRKWMWANKPKMARKWAREEKRLDSDTEPVAKKAIKSYKKCKRGRKKKPFS